MSKDNKARRRKILNSKHLVLAADPDDLYRARVLTLEGGKTPDLEIKYSHFTELFRVMKDRYQYSVDDVLNKFKAKGLKADTEILKEFILNKKCLLFEVKDIETIYLFKELWDLIEEVESRIALSHFIELPKLKLPKKLKTIKKNWFLVDEDTGEAPITSITSAAQLRRELIGCMEGTRGYLVLMDRPHCVGTTPDFDKYKIVIEWDTLSKTFWVDVYKSHTPTYTQPDGEWIIVKLQMRSYVVVSNYILFEEKIKNWNKKVIDFTNPVSGRLEVNKSTDGQ